MFPYSYPPPLLVEILMEFLLVLLILMLQNLSPARLDHYCRRNFQRSVANIGIYHVSLIILLTIGVCLSDLQIRKVTDQVNKRLRLPWNTSQLNSSRKIISNGIQTYIYNLQSLIWFALF